MNVTARATRSGQWWAVEVPEVLGLFTQVKRLEHVAAQVADAVEVLEGISASSVRVAVLPVLDADVNDVVHDARDAATTAAEAQSIASHSMRSAVARLRDEHLTMRDIATVLGISHQRVSQLARS
ncbi:hypothetical protein C5B85_14955 [Pseudoclavibacter sp. AY1F1]|uniref:hypothetical protein n=1 Tax=Pseudoclavibacter sp. AY1F1 TaxID=2080583 RepID=UPI000CE9196B|nr:hypothetical protein [Pseudoclavibacter sp. AY1F1]PPF42874.1 hypothetical protein C5B85_14955 [Pseudoclavibacter sp. AY1F1]